MQGGLDEDSQSSGLRLPGLEPARAVAAPVLTAAETGRGLGDQGFLTVYALKTYCF